MPTIDLCGEEVLDAINSLDTYSRVWMGQFSHLDLVWRMWRFTTYSQSRESRICEELLMGMRALFVPEAAVLGRGTSLGIWSDKVNELAVCAYDMQQVIRHDWSWFNEPEGDHMSRWFDEPYLHGSLPVPSTECHLLDDGSSAMRLSLEGSSLRLLLDALLAYDHLLALRVVALMQIFTRDDRVLAIAQMVEDILRDASLRAYEGLGKHQEDLKELVARVAALAMAYIGKDYRSLALERADSGEPLTHGERRNARLT
jgi:hypothetical protein